MEKTILYVFIYIVEAFILWWYASSLFPSKYSRKVEAAALFSGYAVLFLASQLQSIWVNNICFTLINFLIIFMLYQVKWNICLFHTFIISCIMGLSEVVISELFSNFSITSVYKNTDILLLFLITVLSKLLYYICLRITLNLTRSFTFENGHTNKATTLLNIVPLLSFYIDLVLMAAALNTHLSSTYRYMLSSCAVLLIFMNILIFYIHYYTQQKDKEFMELQIQSQKENDMAEYYKTLFSQNENQQILIHDIRKHLMSISQLNEKNEQEQIREYLVTLLNSSDLQDSVQISDNDLLNSILCHYMKVCQKRHITFKADVRKKLLQNLDYSDLTALFCNLLDNAIAACSDIPDSYIELSITKKENTDITVINVINTCRIAPVFNKYGYPVSQKKDTGKHGLGLKSVDRVIKKYHGNMKMYFDNEKMAFHTIIMLKFQQL